MARVALTRGGAMAVFISIALHAVVAAAATLAFTRAPAPRAPSVVEVAIVQQAPPDAPPPQASRRADTPRSAEATVTNEVLASADLSTNETANADAPPSPVTGAVTAIGAGDVLDPYAARVWSRIAAHRPRGVRGAGDVRIVFGLDRMGRVRFARIAASSGSPAFDRACLAAIRAAAPYPAPPTALDEAELVFEAPMLNERGG